MMATDSRSESIAELAGLLEDDKLYQRAVLFAQVLEGQDDLAGLLEDDKADI